MTPNLPSAPGLDPDDTDPLAIIYEAIEANTNGMKEAAAEAKATRAEVAASDRRTQELLEVMKTHVLANTKALKTFTISEKALADAKDARYLWGIGGFTAGVLFLGGGMLLRQYFSG